MEAQQAKFEKALSVQTVMDEREVCARGLPEPGDASKCLAPKHLV